MKVLWLLVTWGGSRRAEKERLRVKGGPSVVRMGWTSRDHTGRGRQRWRDASTGVIFRDSS